MFVYLDESGDTGFKFPNSSRYFVVTLLLVDDPVPFHNAIDELRGALGFAQDNEFKFYRSSDEVRWAFFRMMRRQSFVARVIVIDKHLMTAPAMRKRDTFYSIIVRLVLTYDNGMIQNAMLILDESVKSKKSKQQFTSFLRKSLNADPTTPKMREIRYHRSSADNLIQAADMLSGAVYAHYSKGNSDLFNYMRPKIADVWDWHPKTE